MNELKLFEYVVLGTNGFLFTIWSRSSWTNSFIKFGLLCMVIWSAKLAFVGVTR